MTTGSKRHDAATPETKAGMPSGNRSGVSSSTAATLPSVRIVSMPVTRTLLASTCLRTAPGPCAQALCTKAAMPTSIHANQTLRCLIRPPRSLEAAGPALSAAYYPHGDGSGLELALVFLLAAVIAVPVFKRFGLGAVLAYLVAGVVLGPDGLALVRDADRILNAAEIGVVMMLFVIGLELSPSRLRVMRKPVFGAGGLQVLLSALLLGGIALLFEHHWKTALVVGLGLALSSTAVSLQLLSERKELTDTAGSASPSCCSRTWWRSRCWPRSRCWAAPRTRR